MNIIPFSGENSCLAMEKPILLLLVLITLLTNTTIASSSSLSTICHKGSAKDYIFGFRDRNCPVSGGESASHRPRFVSVTEGDEGWLQMATEMIDKNKCDYVALLLYAAWCPFSKSIRPSFDAISSLYSSIPHFAIEESSVKASTLSKYGVHGFPTIILLNSTMRVAYRGSRTLDSLVTFYSDVTGIKPVDETPVEKVPHFGNRNSNAEPENCPVTWARRRSPENLFRQETYLTLATVFVVLRLLHFISPTVVMLSKLVWGRFAQNVRLGNLLEHTVATYLKEPSMSSNLQEGAMNARSWASKSLATVSIGDSSSSTRSVSASQ